MNYPVFLIRLIKNLHCKSIGKEILLGTDVREYGFVQCFSKAMCQYQNFHWENQDVLLQLTNSTQVYLPLHSPVNISKRYQTKRAAKRGSSGDERNFVKRQKGHS